MLIHPFTFSEAKAVWKENAEQEMNMTLLFKASIPTSDCAKLALACSTNYILFVNGKFVAVGPARTAHGYHRIDEFELAPYLTETDNVVSIHVTGAAVNSYANVYHDSFLCAEITENGQVVAYTDVSDGGFIACSYPEKLQKVPRYSEQRVFAEVYRLSPDYLQKDMRMECGEPVTLSEISHGNYICRDLFYADYEPIPAKELIAHGTFTVDKNKDVKIPIYYSEAVYRDQYIGRKFPYVSYPMQNAEVLPIIEAQKLCFTHTSQEHSAWTDSLLHENEYFDVDFGYNATGLVSFSIECQTDTKLYLLFDEILTEDSHIDCLRLTSSNVLIWELEAGHYDLITCEPYTMRYLRFACLSGECIIECTALRRIGFPPINCKLTDTDEKLQAVYDAAVETFRQNAYDIYMDCPSRERAGWLCDSFFTARAEYALTRHCEVERVFLTNFLLPDMLPYHPKGMLPMAYPAEQIRIRFIPNWAMWYVLELEEYYARSGDRELVDAAKQKMMELLNYFRPFENEYGLLESLESWVFVEWSHANKLVQDVNFPTNMLYARMKRALSHLYGDETLLIEASAMEEQIRTLSLDGLFFCDNALRTDGKLVLSGEHTETCQYYAFFCGIATPESHPELWNTMLTQFGPERTDTYPDIHPSNAFIGHYLRLDLLSRYGEEERLLDNIKGYFYKMACLTGTLWENDTPKASCCHGFASAIVHWLDLMGKLSSKERN